MVSYVIYSNYLIMQVVVKHQLCLKKKGEHSILQEAQQTLDQYNIPLTIIQMDWLK